MVVRAHEDERTLGDEAGDEVLPGEGSWGGVEGFFVAGAVGAFVGEEILGEGGEARMDEDVCGFCVAADG